MKEMSARELLNAIRNGCYANNKDCSKCEFNVNLIRMCELTSEYCDTDMVTYI